MTQVSATQPTPSVPHDYPDCEFLSAVEPFTVFPERWLSLMAGLMRVETYREDEMIFEVSDVSDAVYVVRSGQVVVFTDTPGEPVQLMARVNAGELFGEVGVLEHSRRTVAARAASDTQVLRIEASDLSRLGRASRRFGSRLAQSALLRHMGDAASRIEMGQRGEVRIRVGKQVLLQPFGQDAVPTVLDNLSLGGACLREVPEDCDFGASTQIAMLLDGNKELLRVEARVAWRKGTSVGLAFEETSPDHDIRVDAALDTLLARAPSPEGYAAQAAPAH